MTPDQTPLSLLLTDIRPPDRRGRAIDHPRVDGIAESIREIGLRQPITVRPRADDEDLDDPPFVIVAGQHRYLAAKHAKLDSIACFVMDTDALHTELWTIDENLLRSEPSAAERSRGFYRRKAIYEALYPQTRHGKNQHTEASDNESEPELGGKRQVVVSCSDDDDSAEGMTPTAATFTEDAARKTGRTQRSIQRDVRRGEKISDDVLDRVENTPLNTGAYLDKLTKLSHDEQREQLERDLEPAGPDDSDGTESRDGDDWIDPAEYFSPEAVEQRELERKDRMMVKAEQAFWALKSQYRKEFACWCVEQIDHWVISREEYAQLFIDAYGQEAHDEALARQDAERKAGRDRIDAGFKAFAEDYLQQFRDGESIGHSTS